MDTFLFDATKLLLPFSRHFVCCIALLAAALPHPAFAEGTVQAQPAGFYLPGSPTWTGATPAAVCVAHPNFCGLAPGTLVGNMTCGIVPGSAVYNPGFCVSFTLPVAPLSSCPPNATGTPTATNPTTCTCDAKFQPDAAGASCVPVSDCPIAALANPPFSDACSTTLENTSSTQAQKDAACGAITPAMESGKQCLSTAISGLGIPFNVTSQVRSLQYQAHFWGIWDKMERLVKLMEDDSAMQTACAARRAEIAAEKGCDNAGPCVTCTASGRNHCLKYPPAPATSTAQHANRNAIDVSAAQTIKPLQTYLNGLRPPQDITQFIAAQNCPITCATVPPTTGNLIWGGTFKNGFDPVHFTTTCP